MDLDSLYFIQAWIKIKHYFHIIWKSSVCFRFKTALYKIGRTNAQTEFSTENQGCNRSSLLRTPCLSYKVT